MKHKLTFNALLELALFLTAAPAFASTTWYVSGVNGSDSNNCKSPTAACKTIGHAIALATSGDTIIVASATYTEHLTIGISLNVLGAGAGTTILDGGYSGGVITIPSASASVILSRMTIRNGHAVYGGGVYNSGKLTITSTTISGNAALGTPTSGPGGGGISNVGTLTINNSTVSDNVATPGPMCNLFVICHRGSGGGINNGGTLTINNSTVSGNVATPVTASCFSCFSSGFGGGISSSGTLTISNSTISGNSAYQGGGINGSATLQNSIVAKNSGGNCKSSNISSNGYNLSSDSTCNFSNSGDRNNIIDPKLGTLGSYGGPTQTLPLLSGSPAIDAGNQSGCTDGQGHLLTTDQRGMLRPDKEDKKGCDMGAYERQSD